MGVSRPTFPSPLPRGGGPDPADSVWHGICSLRGRMRETTTITVPETRKAPLILVIEDDDSVRTLMLRALELSGFRTVSALDSLSAVRQARAEHPDLILSDLMLPGLDGGTTLLSIKDEPGLESTPIILVSGDVEIAARARETGAADFLAKPFLPGDLVRRVRRALKGK